MFGSKGGGVEALELSSEILIIQSENAVNAFFYPTKDGRLLTWPAFLMLTVEPSNAGLISGKRGCEFSSNYNG